MREEQSAIDDRRKVWRKEIRKREIHDLFTKKREVMSLSMHLNQEIVHDDHNKMMQIRGLIKSFSHTKGIEALKEVIRMDRSLSLFFQITGVVPEKVPYMFAEIIKSTANRSNQPPLNINYYKYWTDPQWLRQNSDNILMIDTLLREWEAQNKDLFSILSDHIHTLKEFNLIIQDSVIEFFTLVSNILLVGCWAQSLIQDQNPQLNTDSRTKRSRQLESCTSILLNMLAGPDELLLPFIQQILYSNGGNIRFFGLFHNLFLLKGRPTHTHLDMLRILVRVLTFNSNIFLQDHKEIIYILMIGLIGMQQLTPQMQEEYIGVGEKCITLINQIMKVLIIRYDLSGIYLKVQKTNSDRDEIQFAGNLARLLNKLAENTFICRVLIQAESIRTLILNCLKTTEDLLHLDAIKFFLQVLIKVTSDHLSLECFSNEPRFLTRILNNIKMISRKSLNEVMMEEYYIVSQSFFLLSNCCTNKRIFEMMLDNQIFQLVATFSFRSQKISRIPQILKSDCQYFFLNLLLSIRKYLSEHFESNQLLKFVFAKNENISLFYDLLNPLNDHHILKKILLLLEFFSNYSYKHESTGPFDEFLMSSYLSDTLRTIADERQELADDAHRALHCLRQRNKHSKNEEEIFV